MTAGADGCANSRSRESQDAKRVTAPQLVGILLVLVPRPSLNHMESHIRPSLNLGITHHRGITVEKGGRFAEGQERLTEVSFTNSTAFDPQPPAVHQLSPACQAEPAHCKHAAEEEERKAFLGQVPLLERSGQEQLSRGGARSFTPARGSPWHSRPLAPAALPMPQQGARLR